MSQVQVRCSQCNATCWVKAQYIEYGYSMHEDVDLEEAEWTQGDWIECSHDEDPEIIEFADDPYFPDDFL